ncbi:hypothetical protein DN748_17660 [Sinomicrobium soli]|nr:hypothetical protein DN748_17660 [Sinomicrobium sp. N-1-3-6]
MFKVPVLIQHYTEHQQKYQLDFVDFLTMHYWGHDLDDDDDDRDMQLPFKQVDYGAAHTIYIPVKSFSLNCFVPDIPGCKANGRNKLYPDPNPGELFRPPMA